MVFTANAPATTASAPAPVRRTFGERLGSDLRALPVAGALVLLFVFFAWQNGTFLTPRNLSNLLIQSTVVGIMSIGLIFVMLIREIDLSLAAINGVTAVLMAKLMVEFGVPPWLAVTTSVLAGCAIASMSALWINYVGVPSFIVTLGLGLALNGLQLMLLPATARYDLMSTGVALLAQINASGIAAWIVLLVALLAYSSLLLSNVARRRRSGLAVRTLPDVIAPIALTWVLGILFVWVLCLHQGVPLIVMIFAFLLGLGGYVLSETQFGLHLYAIGNNHEAARRAGINVEALRIGAFAVSGGIAALAGVVGASRAIGVGVFSGGGVGGGTLLLEVIAATVIGGVSLFGGRGGIHAALLGSLIIGTVSNGLNLMGVDNKVRLIVTGLMLVLAVSVDKIIDRATGQQSF